MRKWAMRSATWFIYWRRPLDAARRRLPFRPSDVIGGKIAPYFLFAAVDMVLVTVLGIILFDVPFNGSRSCTNRRCSSSTSRPPESIP
jgi:hypothetical protein